MVREPKNKHLTASLLCNSQLPHFGSLLVASQHIDWHWSLMIINQVFVFQRTARRDILWMKYDHWQDAHCVNKIGLPPSGRYAKRGKLRLTVSEQSLYESRQRDKYLTNVITEKTTAVWHASWVSADTKLIKPDGQPCLTIHLGRLQKDSSLSCS